MFQCIFMPKFTQNAETVILEEGTEVQQTKAYGIGIDCHSKFMQVSVYEKRDLKFFEYRHEFATDWNSLIQAKEWCVRVLTTCSSPVLSLSDMPFHYCIESTIHLPYASSSCLGRYAKHYQPCHCRCIET